MGGEQGEGPPMHHPHLQPHGVMKEGEIAEGAIIDRHEMATIRTRLAELRRKYAQQHQVRDSGDIRMYVCV